MGREFTLKTFICVASVAVDRAIPAVMQVSYIPCLPRLWAAAGHGLCSVGTAPAGRRTIVSLYMQTARRAAGKQLAIDCVVLLLACSWCRSSGCSIRCWRPW